MKIEWYEVFKSSKLGTQTMAICKTLKEARRRKRHYERKGYEVHIDKWRDINEPEIIKKVE
jgi:hypothetical protein